MPREGLSKNFSRNFLASEILNLILFEQTEDGYSTREEIQQGFAFHDPIVAARQPMSYYQLYKSLEDKLEIAALRKLGDVLLAGLQAMEDRACASGIEFSRLAEIQKYKVMLLAELGEIETANSIAQSMLLGTTQPGHHGEEPEAMLFANIQVGLAQGAKAEALIHVAIGLANRSDTAEAKTILEKALEVSPLKFATQASKVANIVQELKTDVIDLLEEYLDRLSDSDDPFQALTTDLIQSELDGLRSPSTKTADITLPAFHGVDADLQLLESTTLNRTNIDTIENAIYSLEKYFGFRPYECLKAKHHLERILVSAYELRPLAEPDSSTEVLKARDGDLQLKSGFGHETNPLNNLTYQVEELLLKIYLYFDLKQDLLALLNKLPEYRVVASMYRYRDHIR